MTSLIENTSLRIADVMNKKGYTVTINYPSDKIEYDLNKYDIIVFGSPVFADNISPVLKEYIVKNPVENKKIILYTTGKFSDKKNELEKLKSCISSNNEIYAEKYTKDTEDTFLEFINKSI